MVPAAHVPESVSTAARDPVSGGPAPGWVCRRALCRMLADVMTSGRRLCRLSGEARWALLRRASVPGAPRYPPSIWWLWRRCQAPAWMWAAIFGKEEIEMILRDSADPGPSLMRSSATPTTTTSSPPETAKPNSIRPEPDASSARPRLSPCQKATRVSRLTSR
jgi:hypothetical protein